MRRANPLKNDWLFFLMILVQIFKLPSIIIVISLSGIFLPLAAIACFAIETNPEQHGTSMCTTSRLFSSEWVIN